MGGLDRVRRVDDLAELDRKGEERHLDQGGHSLGGLYAGAGALFFGCTPTPAPAPAPGCSK